MRRGSKRVAKNALVPSQHMSRTSNHFKTSRFFLKMSAVEPALPMAALLQMPQLSPQPKLHLALCLCPNTCTSFSQSTKSVAHSVLVRFATLHMPLQCLLSQGNAENLNLKQLAFRHFSLGFCICFRSGPLPQCVPCKLLQTVRKHNMFKPSRSNMLNLWNLLDVVTFGAALQKPAGKLCTHAKICVHVRMHACMHRRMDGR